MKTETRFLEERDIDEIIPLRINLQFYGKNNNLLINKRKLEEATREFLIKNLNKDLYMFGTFVDNELVAICGFIVLNIFPELSDLTGKVAYITTVFTKEKHRKKGYQRKVLEKCIENAKKMGIKRFNLRTENPQAMKLYSSMGFIDDEKSKKMILY